MTSEPSAIEAASTGQLLRRYRKLAGLTAQELAHEVNSRYPDDAISATVVFNIEAERKTAITIPELARFAEVPAISPIQLLCDCDQPPLRRFPREDRATGDRGIHAPQGATERCSDLGDRHGPRS